MNLKKVVSLAILIGGIVLCGESSKVYAVGYNQESISSWGGSEIDAFDSVISTSDGGAVAVGRSNSTDAGFVNQGSSDAIVVKYDSEGNQEWMTSWGGSDYDNFMGVIETSDKGVIVVGQSRSTDAGFVNQGGYDGVIVKYDSEGNQEWIKSWGGSGIDAFNSIIRTSDGGFVVVGCSSSANVGFTNQGNRDAIIIKYNQDGDQQWIKSWGGNNLDVFRSITKLSDGGFVAVGFSHSTNVGFVNQGLSDAIVVKYDSEGNQEWMTSWGGSDYDNFMGVIETSDKGVIVVGQSRSTNAGFVNQGGYDGVIVKYDSEGNQEWRDTLGGNTDDTIYSVIETLDKKILAVGVLTADGLMVQYDLDGIKEWEQRLVGNYMDTFASVVQTSDGDVIVVGSSYSKDLGFISVGSGMSIIIKYSPKTDADIQINGNIQAMMADVTIPSVSPDLVIDPNLPQGSVSPEFGIINDSTSPIKLELKTFEQTTNTFNDVLPDKYDLWEGLNKTQSQDLALGLIAKEGDGWQQLTTPTSYVVGHTEHEIGVIKPTSQVNFEFEVHHGRAFSESKTVQYRMVFVFDLLN